MMKLRRSGLACLLCATVIGAARPAAVVVLPVALVACANQSPTQRYSLTQDTFINFQKRANTLKMAGKISNEDWKNKVLPLMREIDAALDQWEAALVRGDPNAGDFANIVSAALDRLSAYLVSKGGN